MIEKITVNNSNILKIEKLFPQFLRKNQIKNDLESNPFTNYYVYKENEEILGFINYNILYERAELIYIAVQEKKQNQGIGSQLMEFMIRDCEEKKLINITLEVNIQNKKAIELYEKFEFKKKAIREKYYQGIDGILMEKELIK